MQVQIRLESQYSLFHKGFPEFQSRICIRMAAYISMESLLPAKSAPQISPTTAYWHEDEHYAGESVVTNNLTKKIMVDGGGCGLFLQWGVRWFLGGTFLFGLK